MNLHCAPTSLNLQLRSSIQSQARFDIAMAPGFVVLVLYPRKPGTTFDWQYYLSKHTPLANEIWGPYGMKMHSISEMAAESGYHQTCVIEWESKEGYEKAQQDDRSKEIMADIADGNFTTASPVFLAGKIVG